MYSWHTFLNLIFFATTHENIDRNGMEVIVLMLKNFIWQSWIYEILSGLLICAY